MIANEHNAFIISCNVDLALTEIPGVISSEEVAIASSKREFDTPQTVFFIDDIKKLLQELGFSREGFLFFFLLQGGYTIRPVKKYHARRYDIIKVAFEHFPWKNETDLEFLKEVYIHKCNGKEYDFDYFFQEYDIRTFPDYNSITRFLTSIKDDEEMILRACGVTKVELEGWFNAMLEDILTTDFVTCLISPELNKFIVIPKLAASSSMLYYY